jgi:hypothetical protein
MENERYMATWWIPETAEQLTTALADGRLDEGAHLDFKRELAGGKKANLELARDLAMFANDGGVLIFGVAEPEAGRYDPAPVPLDGVRERIEQVAASRLEPPLHVDVRVLPAEHDSSIGFVLVRVPASATAPHMVDERYYGRAGSTRTVLSDAQVRALLRSRSADLGRIDQVLDADIARDPIPDDRSSHGHLHVVAKPRFARHDLVLADLRRVENNWSTWFHKELLPGVMQMRLNRWAPDLKGDASSIGRRAHGAAIHSHYLEQDRSASELLSAPDKLANVESRLLDLEVDEDGTLHLYCGRGTDTIRDRAEVLLPAVVAGLVLRVVAAADRISALTGYVGTWDFAVAVTGLRGVTRYTQDIGAYTPAYSAEMYRQTASADTAELATDPRACAERLVSRLLRGLGLGGGVDAVFPRDE